MRNMKKIIILMLTVTVFTLFSYTILSSMIKGNGRIKSGKDFTIYTTSDLHYLSDKLTDNGAAYQKYISSGDGKQLGYIDEIFDAFSYDIKKAKPDILIISGDLTNNGEKESHLELAEKLKYIEKSGTSVYVIPGNHDILNPWARGFKADKQYVADSISPEEFSEIYADFGYKEAVSRDAKTLSYLVEPSDEIWLLMLDTNRYNENISLGMPEADGILGKSTLDWIKECSDMAKEKGATIITVMHHNILNHSDVIQEGYTLNNSGQAQILFNEDNLKLVFSGHIHVQDISSDGKADNPLYDIASGSLAVNPHLYGIMKYSAKDSSLDYNTSIVDVEGWAKNKGMKDENLLNFKKYSEDYFGKLAYDKTYNQLLMQTDYPKEKLQLMSDTMKILNIRYFSGTENLNSKDVINSEGYKLWMNLPDSFRKDYILSVSSDKDTDDNHLHIKIPFKNPETN